jgi:hypothetical protein
MKIRSIDFEEGEEGAIPSEITATMTLAEAVAITHIFGKFSDGDWAERGLPRTEVYNVLTGDVFNRYWDDGVDGALLDVRARA